MLYITDIGGIAMKKVIIAIIIVALVAAAGIGAYFIFNDNNSDEFSVRAVREDFVDSPALLERIAQHPERYQDNLATEYEMGEEKAAEFYECPEEWLTYEQLITIYNDSSESITVYGFEVENNGKNGVYLSTSVGGELAIAPGGYGPATFSVFCDNGDLSTDEAKALTEKFDVKVIYTKTPTEYDDGTESVEETQVAKLGFVEE